MRIYFAADTQADNYLQERFGRIVDIFHGAGAVVMSNIIRHNIGGFSSAELERMDQSGELMIDGVDCVVIEGTHSFSESGYLVAAALAHRKPILYLIERGKVFNNNLRYLQRQKDVAGLLYLEAYTSAGLEKVLLDFIAAAELGGGREVPSIKFTLRITPRIERYLQWKTHNTTLSKADYLRTLIEGVIGRDEEFKKFSGHTKKSGS